jgi:hypothetical protein
MQFTDLGLSAGILRAIVEQGYDTPTPIQREAIPHVLAGSDLEAMAQTGTGKTAAFVLPILQRLTNQGDSPLERVSRNRPRALILVPTRELAAQVQESIRTYGKHVPIRSLAVFGGVGMQPQVQVLRRGVDIVVATPGRLLDHLTQRTIDLGAVATLVLDEADRMLDMGFIRDIRKIIERLPKQRQNLMFSATFASEVRELAHTVLRNPVMVEVARRNSPTELVTQSVIRVDKERKRDALLHLFENHGWHQTLVFTRTKHGADALARKLGRRPFGSHPWRQDAGCANPRLGRLQGRQTGRAGSHRHRRARHRHRPAAAGGELRTAQRARGLCTPHRPHRPRRLRRGSTLAGQPRRTYPIARHRTAHQARSTDQHPAGIRTQRQSGLRIGPVARQAAAKAHRRALLHTKPRRTAAAGGKEPLGQPSQRPAASLKTAQTLNESGDPRVP